MSVRVSAPCRLHFGLFHVPVPGLTHWPDGRPVRKFGGVGLMVETPRVVVELRDAEATSAAGPLGERALQAYRRFCAGMGEFPAELSATGPTQHTGLGVGTALGMSVARGAMKLLFFQIETLRPGETPLSFEASLVGRGLRSAIGVYGFDRGGLIVDDGKERNETLAPLVSRSDWPDEWRVVLVRSPGEPLWHGETERTAFGRYRTPEQALAVTERLRVIADEQIVPAVEQLVFDRFAEAVHEFNRVAGEPFAADQGGAYSSMAVNCVIDELLGWGVTGVGQSSWGPTVFAFARDADEADHLARRLRAWLPADADVTVTAADNQGARIETL